LRARTAGDYGERVSDLALRSHIVQPAVLASAKLTDDLRVFFKTLSVLKGRQSTYASWMHAYGNTSLANKEVTTLADIFASVDLGNKDVHYEAFNEGRAHLAHHDSVRERRESLHWLGRVLRPKLALVELKAPSRRGNVLKAALGLRCGCVLTGLRRQEDAEASDRPDLVQGLLLELESVSLSLPLITTSLDSLTFESMLAASTVCDFDCFLRVDPLFLAGRGSRVRLDWRQPGPADDGVGFLDSLRRAGGQDHDTVAYFRPFEVDRRVRFFGIATRSGNCWAQRELPQGPAVTLKLMLARARALDSVDIGLGDTLVERIRLAPRAHKGYPRVQHAITMSGMFSLFSNLAAAKDPAPNNWTRLYDDWDAVPIAQEVQL